MITRNDDNIQELIDGNTHVMVQLGASWCYPCKQLKPKVEKISFESPDVVFAYVDIDASPGYCTNSKVMSVPTVIGYHNGVEIERVVGSNESAVKELLEKLRKRANS
jgi:thioredoxin-like negative regulator of GroEL